MSSRLMPGLSESPSNAGSVDFNQLLQEHPEDVTPSPYELNDLTCSYWSADTLAQNISQSKSNLVLHLNTQCLPAKFDNLVTFLNLLSSNEKLPFVLALSETWLCDFNENSFPINGFNPIVSEIRKDNSARGGVALYIREDLNFKPRPDLTIFQFYFRVRICHSY